MCSWNERTKSRKGTPLEWFIIILAIVLLWAFSIFMLSDDAQGQAIPPTSTPMMSSTSGVFPVPFTPTPLPIVTPSPTPEPYHSNVYLPLIMGGA